MKGWITAGAVAVAAGMGARGALRRLPDPYPDPSPSGEMPLQPMPDLPEPVAAYLDTVAPELPLMTSAVITGRFTMRIRGLALPGRWRFTHDVERGYRHELEVIVLGRRVLGGDELYVDGHARLDLPGGRVEGPEVDAAALLGMWAEYGWLPSVLATGRWEAVDAVSALLHVPGGQEPLRAWFDPQTRLLTRFETLRWRDAGDPGPLPWVTATQAWTRIGGIGVPAVGSVHWGDQAQPWLRLSLDHVAWNVPVTL